MARGPDISRGPGRIGRIDTDQGARFPWRPYRPDPAGAFPLSLTTFALAVLALLATPGPTNTLTALAGAERGLARALRLIPAEVAAYLAVVLPLGWAGSVWLDAAPGARPALAGVAAVWVMVLAIRLWQLPAADGPAATVTARQVFVTTCLNPKALVFGLVLMPPREGLALRALVFAALVAGVALIWTGLGAALRRPGRAGMPPLLRRAAAGWLALLSLMLAARAMAG